MVRLFSMDHVDKRIRISFLVVVMLVASVAESVGVEAANARVLHKTKPTGGAKSRVKRSPSLAQPDYTVYHTK